MSALEVRDDVEYLVFDIESVPDPALVSLVRTHGEVDPDVALQEYRDELIEKKGSDFVPYTYHVPISVALAKLREDLSLKELTVLKVEEGGPKQICERFWQGWNFYKLPTLVTFNGRKFDIPLLELTAFRYGIRLREWFTPSVDKSPSRSRFSYAHVDLYDVMSNYGASFIEGGLNLVSKLIHKPGKLDVKGDMVLEMFKEGKLDEIHSYCRCDVLDTYFLFLRYQVVRGAITFQQEQELIEQARAYLEEQVEKIPVYQEYLDAWRKIDDYWNSHDQWSAYQLKNDNGKE